MTSTDQTEFVEEGLQCLYLENKTCSFFPPTTRTKLVGKSTEEPEKATNLYLITYCNIHLTNFKWASLTDQH